MFTVTQDTRFLNKLGYQDARPVIGRLIFPITRYLRTKNVLRHVKDEAPARLLDIGCGDGYFLKRLKHLERYGQDPQLEGEQGNFNNGLRCPNCFF